MDRNSLFVGVGGVAVLVILAAIGFSRVNSSSNGASRDPELIAAIDRLNASQERLADRLDRLESSKRPSGAGWPARAALPGAPGANKDASGNGSTPGANQDLNADKQRATMEDRFVREPLSPNWAMTNEKNIGSLLSPGNLAKQQLPVPKAYQAQCHSHMCRISMTFADQTQASQTQAMLLMQIAPSLSRALIFEVPQPDGSLELVVFAGDAEQIH